MSRHPLLSLILASSSLAGLDAQTSVTLSPAASPSAGQPGITAINVTGSGFPAGTIPPSNVTAALQPAAGGSKVTTPASAVTTIVGSTRRVTFTIPSSINVAAPTSYKVSISGSTSTGTTFASSNTASLTINPGAELVSVVANAGQQGQALSVTITCQYTNFVQGSTQASFGAGVSVGGATAGGFGPVTVTSATTATAMLVIASDAAPGPRTVTIQTGAQQATQAGGFTVNSASSGPTITDFNPKSAPTGTLITVAGANLQPNAGTSAQVNLAKQGGGTIVAMASSTAATSLSFVIPSGAATGPLSVTVNGSSSPNSAAPLTIVPSSTFTVSAAPNSANLIRGQSTAYVVSLASTSGFNQLASLSVSGVPNGVTASFKPPQITAGQTSVLTLTAPAGQPTGTSTLAVSASATVDGISVTQSAAPSLNVTPATTSLLGRTVVSDSLETPLAHVTITMLGKDGNGNTTGCTGSAVSDDAGNFALTNLSEMCVGPQLVGFDGTTVTSPPGKYAGVNLVFTFAAGQVTTSPVLVHLPRIDNVETFLVQQNSASDQSYSFNSIPGLSVTVYAGTTFTMPDGTKPDPFPLAAVQVPVDRLPDAKPNVPTMLRVFIVAFQPANAFTNQPVAVYFPNTLNTPPGADMVLMTLDPTHGQMVPYGTGTVSADATQIVPDADPAHPGHLYGLVHFDWHGPMPSPPSQVNPAPPGSGGSFGGGVGTGPGWGPGGSSGPGNGDGGDNGGDQDGSDNGGDTGNNNVDNNGPKSGCNSCNCNDSNPPVPVLGIQGENLAPPRIGPGGENSDLLLRAKRRQTSTDRIEKPYSDEHGAEAGDPVDLSSGVQTLSHRDIAINGSRATIALVRTYRSMTTQGGPFGIGTSHNFNYGLNTAFPTLTPTINLIMPDGNRFPFASRLCPHIVGPDIAPCTPGFTNATVPALAGAVMTINADSTTDLRWKNGTMYHFIPISFQQGSLLGSITDRNGNTISIARDASGNVTTITDPVGRTLTFAYDSSNRVTSISDPIGRTVSYTYNSQGSLATFTNPAGGVTQYSYDANNNMLKMIDARGIVRVQNTLDASGRVITQVRADGGTLTFNYTPANPDAPISPVLMARVTDSLGVQATYRFNMNGYVTDITNTQGQTRTFDFLAGSNFKSDIVEASAKTSYTYDSNGNVLTSTDPTGLTTTFTYDPVFNKVTSITDPLGNVSRFTYDSNGNLQTSTDADGNLTSYKYDSTGLVTQVTDQLKQVTTYAYDAAGNLASVTDPLGNTTTYGYDGISRLTLVVDALGRRTSYQYDALGHRVTATDANGGVTTTTYDADGNVTSVKDARGNTTSFTYDPMNRLVSRTDTLGRSDSRSYDTNGNLLKYVDRRGQTSLFAYDNLGRLQTETYSDATVTRAYDFSGQLEQVTDSAAGVFTFDRDLAGRLLGSTSPNGAVKYTYDGRGFMASRQVVGQPAVSYTYDSAGNLSSATLPQASASFTYTARNELANITRLNGVSSAYAYDNDARLTSITHAKGATTLDAESYAYDAVGNRSSRATAIGQPLITQATVNQHNANNQMTQYGSVINSYDANGNLVQEAGGNTYVWDGRNRLKSITEANGQTTTFVYDFAGNLITQTITGSSTTLTKGFVLDDLTNLAYEAASDGTSYSVLSGRSIDSHMAVVQSTGPVQYALSDAINSTVATTDEAGAIQSSFSYEPFGQTTTSSSFPFQFTGRMPVSSTTDYYRARFYSSQTGRFVSEDPIGFHGGDSNLYRYVGNAPTRLRDPLGLQTTVVTSTGTPVNVSGTSYTVNSSSANPPGYYCPGGGMWCAANPPSQNQPVYGNYCGPGNYPGAPTDTIDVCCALHDQCYGAIGQTAQCRSPFNVGALVCDTLLTMCWANLPFPVSGPQK